MEYRVVVTGIGVVTPIGIGVDAYWKGLTGGACGIGPITRFDTTGHKAKLAGEVRDFEPADFMNKKDIRRTDRFCQFAVAASRMALEDAGLDTEHGGGDGGVGGVGVSVGGVGVGVGGGTGVFIGSGVGGILTWEAEHTKLMERGPGRVSPLFIPMMIPNMAAGVVSMTFGLHGASLCPVSACATGTDAIGAAFLAIREGRLASCLAGGAEAAITPLAIAGFANMTALSTAEDPSLGSLPFDKRRTGFVLGEGAGVLLLETLAGARARGARVYCEITGYGASSDAYHLTGPDPEGRGAAKAMIIALSQAGLPVAKLAHINAHGTGTPLGDKIETQAIRRVMGTAARKVAVSATKSMTGHLLGASGGVEAAATALAVYHGVLPPTIHLHEPDPDCDLDYVPLTARACPIPAAMSNSLGFGGHNASLVFAGC
ncbi:MAG: beta-ketoacyl-[acyl-carrier-protein] synthase II [Oscillospiraceae bacterium]|nr:beta-ketoacyl-[acyl-carrier-protein] synthase II [Oscillospiraceae bacterium]